MHLPTMKYNKMGHLLSERLQAVHADEVQSKGKHETLHSATTGPGAWSILRNLRMLGTTVFRRGNAESIVGSQQEVG